VVHTTPGCLTGTNPDSPFSHFNLQTHQPIKTQRLSPNLFPIRKTGRDISPFIRFALIVECVG
jgi:hypothetical protein